MNGSPGYAPYNPNKQKRASTQSTQGFVRPGNAGPSSPSPAGTVAAAAAAGGGRHTPSSSTFISNGRNSPVRSSTPDSGSFPFHSVPAGASPFPPSTPNRAGSPAVGGGPSTPSASSSNYNSTKSPPPHTAGTSAGAGGVLANTSAGREASAKMPYRTGFQPQGVRRDRTEEIVLKRRARSDGKKLEEGRLGRRMEKLVALHFPPPSDEPEIPAGPRSTLSSISDFSGSLRTKTAKDLWRSVAGSKSEIERAEQGIVKWQDDAEAVKCPICTASFGLKTRRHHCRLCGRVVCFLPPSPASDLLASTLPPSSPNAQPPRPIRRERCSTFFTYEYEGVLVGSEKKPVGVIVEVEPVEQDNSFQAIVANEPAGQGKEKDERKKIRLCRDCMGTVLRQQEKSLPPVTPNWLKLYDVLVQLEKDIEDALPEFQELILSIQKPSIASSHPSASHAQSLRKRLLTNLASYDTIAKRIRELPLSEYSSTGGSQDRLQRAIAQRGALFLGEKLALLRTLGDIEGSVNGVKKGKGKKNGGGGKGEEGEPEVRTLASLLGKEEGKLSPAEEEKAAQLAVLVQQETLVRGYMDAANAARQFEDAASLKASLDELTEEIRRVRLTP